MKPSNGLCTNGENKYGMKNLGKCNSNMKKGLAEIDMLRSWITQI